MLRGFLLSNVLLIFVINGIMTIGSPGHLINVCKDTASKDALYYYEVQTFEAGAERTKAGELAVKLSEFVDVESVNSKPHSLGYIGEGYAVIQLYPQSGGRDVLILADFGDGFVRVDTPPNMPYADITGGTVTADGAVFLSFNSTVWPNDGVTNASIYASFDRGATWEKARGVEFSKEQMEELFYPMYLSPRFDGSHGVLPVYVTSDGSVDGEPAMYYFESMDSGSSWSFAGRCDGLAK